MNDLDATAEQGPSLWTCPFCPLLCDTFSVGAESAGLRLVGSDCPRARAGLAQFNPAAAPALPELNGQSCALDEAIASAAQWLAASRQPLISGLGTDVAGARALYPLACAIGAICDPTGGEALMHGLRALQDRGQFSTTLAEVRTRADLIVFLGGLPTDLAPLLAQRCGISDPQVAQRHVVVVGASPADNALLADWTGPGVSTETVPLHGDLFTTVALLSALVAQQPLPSVPEDLAALALRLRAARYAVIVGAPARLPTHGALIVEAVNQVVGTLNRTTRAASLWVGGGDGAATVNQTFAWLSGLPLRSRAGPRGLEHEPLAFDTTRLLAAGAVDLLLWVASFDAEDVPPLNNLPMVVLGPPAMAAACRRPGLPTVFIPVATPGIGADGHLFRTDGTVLMPLKAVYRSPLPGVAGVIGHLTQALRQGAVA